MKSYNVFVYSISTFSENASASNELFEELQPQYPDHLPLSIARLQALEAEKGGDRSLKTIIDTADTVIKSIDTTELLEYYGLKFDARPDASKIKTYDANFVSQNVNFHL